MGTPTRNRRTRSDGVVRHNRLHHNARSAELSADLEKSSARAKARSSGNSCSQACLGLTVYSPLFLGKIENSGLKLAASSSPCSGICRRYSNEAPRKDLFPGLHRSGPGISTGVTRGALCVSLGGGLSGIWFLTTSARTPTIQRRRQRLLPDGALQCAVLG